MCAERIEQYSGWMRIVHPKDPSSFSGVLNIQEFGRDAEGYEKETMARSRRGGERETGGGTECSNFKKIKFHDRRV